MFVGVHKAYNFFLPLGFSIRGALGTSTCDALLWSPAQGAASRAPEDEIKNQKLFSFLTPSTFQLKSANLNLFFIQNMKFEPYKLFYEQSLSINSNSMLLQVNYRPFFLSDRFRSLARWLPLSLTHSLTN